MRSWQLRAHIAGLVAESRRTRTVLRKAYSADALLRIKERLLNGEFRPTQIERIMHKVRSGYSAGVALPEDRRVIVSAIRANVRRENAPSELSKLDPQWIDDSADRCAALHYHRTVTLRRELRACNLAYGLLLGHGLNEMEDHGGKPIPLPWIRSVAEEYGGNEYSQDTFESWVDEIRPNSHPKPANIAGQLADIEARLARATSPAYRAKLVGQIDRLDIKRRGIDGPMRAVLIDAGEQETHHGDE